MVCIDGGDGGVLGIVVEDNDFGFVFVGCYGV